MKKNRYYADTFVVNNIVLWTILDRNTGKSNEHGGYEEEIAFNSFFCTRKEARDRAKQLNATTP